VTAAAPAASSRIEVPGGAVDVTIRGASAVLSDQAILEWVATAARAVATYYGGLPARRIDLAVRIAGPGRGVGGRTDGWTGVPRIRMSLGEQTTPDDLAKSWQLVHEMVHVAFPSMTGHAWIEEGLATYVEPLVRARVGLAPADDIWRWLTWGLPRGLDGIGARGLDASPTWGATYWGGALFCFLADLQIRERSGGARSLDDALRGIVRAGGNVTVSWDIDRAFEAGDRATGVPVLEQMYARMGRRRPEVDLPILFRELGVETDAGALAYDDAAPLARVRRGITTGR
jgi:hypothetical protein